MHDFPRQLFSMSTVILDSSLQLEIIDASVRYIEELRAKLRSSVDIAEDRPCDSDDEEDSEAESKTSEKQTSVNVVNRI